MKKATLAIIIQDGKILLGRKQGSPEIGEGTINGPGGKQEPGESLLQCLVRETEEELGIRLDPAQATKTNIITFFAAGEPSFEVHFYHAPAFVGEPCETESMIPEWHPLETIPYERMLESDRDWFPRVVQGERFNLDVYYREKAKGYEGIGAFLPFEDHE